MNVIEFEKLVECRISPITFIKCDFITDPSPAVLKIQAFAVGSVLSMVTPGLTYLT